MLNLKKVIALVCVFALALTTVAFGATYSDVAEDSAYYEAVETLNKLNIITGYEDGTFKPEDGVTRAEMAALIARIQGYGETAKGSANTGFTDVPATHWASGYIANAAGMGIINGYGDGTFGPEDQVLYEQAVKMVMATLGYTPFAEKNGGYPTGYLAAAQRYDVSLAVANAVQGAPANRGTVAQILENALDTPLMIQSSWNTNGEVTYIIADGAYQGDDAYGNPRYGDYKTLMSENLGYVKIRGIVTETPVTKIGGSKEINTAVEEKVEIDVLHNYMTDNKLFKQNIGKDGIGKADFFVNGTDAADYLGRSVIAYVKANSKDRFEIVSIAIDTNRNEELVINLDQYQGAVEGETNKLAYLKEGANQSTKITIAVQSANPKDEPMAVVYNFDGNTGKTLDALVDGLYGGTITFIDNDDVIGYDVAIVEQAATAVVDEVEDGYVAFKTAAELAKNTGELDGLLIDEDDENVIVQIQKDGEVIDIAELQEWDVLSVIASDSKAKVIVAEVVTNQVIGTIASTKSSKTSAANIVNGKGVAYSIDGTWYDVAANQAGDTLKIGLGGTFFIDKYGKIAAFNEDSALAGGAVANYGYIFESTVDDKTTFGNPVLKVQMLTENGVEVLELRNNAKLNDVVIYDASVTDNTTPAAKSAKDAENKVDALKGKVVKFTKNAAGDLSTIATASTANDFTEKIFLNDQQQPTSVAAKFDEENTKLEGAVYVDADAKIFAIGGKTQKTTVKDSKILTVADFADKNNYTVYTAYATDKADDYDMIVVGLEGFAKAGATAGLAVITGVSETSNDEDEPVWGLTYYVDGEEVEGLTDAETAEGTKPTIGDVVKIKSANGVITSVEYVFNLSESIRTTAGAMTTPTWGVSDGNGGYKEAYSKDGKEVFAAGWATAYKKTSGQITLSGVSNTYNGGQFKLLETANKYVIDFTANDDIEIGTTGSYKYFAALYDETDDNVNDLAGKKFALEKNDKLWAGTTVSNDVYSNDIDAATAIQYTDYVMLREYDGRVTDIIIVRGADTVTKTN